MTYATPPEDKDLLTPAEVGRRIGRSRATVYRLINSGQIPTVTIPVAKPADPNKPGQGAVRITRGALNEFVSSLERKAS